MINRTHSKSTMFTKAIPEGCKRLAGRLRSSATDTPGNSMQSTPTPAGVVENSFRIYKSQSPPVGRGSCRAIIRPSPSAFFLNCCTITPPREQHRPNLNHTQPQRQRRDPIPAWATGPGNPPQSRQGLKARSIPSRDMRNFPSLNCQLSIIPIHGLSYHNIPTGNPERVAITQPRVGRRGLPGVIAPGNPNAVGVESNPLSQTCPSMLSIAPIPRAPCLPTPSRRYASD